MKRALLGVFCALTLCVHADAAIITVVKDRGTFLSQAGSTTSELFNQSTRFFRTNTSQSFGGGFNVHVIPDATDIMAGVDLPVPTPEIIKGVPIKMPQLNAIADPSGGDPSPYLNTTFSGLNTGNIFRGEVRASQGIVGQDLSPMDVHFEFAAPIHSFGGDWLDTLDIAQAFGVLNVELLLGNTSVGNINFEEHFAGGINQTWEFLGWHSDMPFDTIRFWNEYTSNPPTSAPPIDFNYFGLDNVEFSGGGDEVNVVPEPGTFAVWSILGLFGFVGYRRRQRAKQ